MLFYKHAEAARNGDIVDQQEFIKQSFPDLVVRNGPFKGMKYPTSMSTGSALLPKLLGSYESELQGIFDTILQTNYTDIIDIGCAEGYYTVGLAMRKPNARVLGFDTNPRALAMCRQMAKANGVSISLDGFCDAARLLSIPLGDKALIISDCEGYEKQLFTPEVVRFLQRHDVLIEVHESDDASVSSTLKRNFAATHNITTVESIDDLRKVRHYQIPELANYNPRERLSLLAEYRPQIMDWFYFTPK
jgi:SAM-dependent methyltransferase